MNRLLTPTSYGSLSTGEERFGNEVMAVSGLLTDDDLSHLQELLRERLAQQGEKISNRDRKILRFRFGLDGEIRSLGETSSHFELERGYVLFLIREAFRKFDIQASPMLPELVKASREIASMRQELEPYRPYFPSLGPTYQTVVRRIFDWQPNKPKARHIFFIQINFPPMLRALRLIKQTKGR